MMYSPQMSQSPEKIRKDVRLGKLRYESKYLAIRHFHETKGRGIGWMCGQLGVTRAAYNKWMHREIPQEEQENIKLAGLIGSTMNVSTLF